MRLCEEENCFKNANYNYKGGEKKYCFSHRKNGMINLSGQVCKVKECNKMASFNYDNCKNRIYCACHKKPFMINLSSRKKERVCEDSFKTKEKAVVNYIKNKFPNKEWKYNEIIKGGNFKRRPDLLLDLGFRIIIIENDEYQHSKYSLEYEKNRLMEICNDLKNREVVCNRFNPDCYKINNERILSCWKTNRVNRRCYVKRKKEDEWVERLETLKNKVEYWLNEENKTNENIKVIKLFYDEDVKDINNE